MRDHLSILKFMLPLLIFLASPVLLAQFNQNVNFGGGVIYGIPITEIDSVSFDEVSNLINIFNTSGEIISYPIMDIENVTFSEQAEFPSGFVHCGPETEVVEITSPLTGRIWMDRNLGASQVASSISDSLAYGDLYQWGRFADGHQCRNSQITTILSSSDTPGHSEFILALSNPVDWRNPQNNNLWQGLSGNNNPCPEGFRIPTSAEWDEERFSWNSLNLNGAYESTLKLTASGSRSVLGGELDGVDSYGRYWSSTVFLDINSRSINISNNNVSNSPDFRARGASCRCIKEQ